jgi:hypothetical protein
MSDDLNKEESGDGLELHNVQIILAQCEELSLLGQYKAALDLLGPLTDDLTLRTSEMVDVLRATSQIFVLRGYPQTAKECIQNALTLDHSQLEKHQILALNVHHAFITIVACGEELENDECLHQAEEWLKSLKTLDAFNREAVSSINANFKPWNCLILH